MSTNKTKYQLCMRKYPGRWSPKMQDSSCSAFSYKFWYSVFKVELILGVYPFGRLTISPVLSFLLPIFLMCNNNAHRNF